MQQMISCSVEADGCGGGNPVNGAAAARQCKTRGQMPQRHARQVHVGYEPDLPRVVTCCDTNIG